MAEFGTETELLVKPDPASLRSTRETIESELGDITVQVEANTGGASSRMGRHNLRDPQSGRFVKSRGSEQRLMNLLDVTEDMHDLDEIRNDLLRELIDETESDNFTRAKSLGGGLGMLGLLGIAAAGAAVGGAVSFFRDFEFKPPDIPPLEAPEIPPVDFAPLPEWEWPAIPEPDWLPIVVKQPGGPAPLTDPEGGRISTPNYTTSPTPRPDRTPSGDPDLPPITDPFGGPLVSPEDIAIGLGAAGGGAAVGAGAAHLARSRGAAGMARGGGGAAGAPVGAPQGLFSQIPGVRNRVQDIVRGLGGGDLVSARDRADRRRGGGVQVENTVEVQGKSDREIERIVDRRLESFRRELERELT